MPKAFITDIDGLCLEDVSVGSAGCRYSVEGDARHPVRNLVLKNVTIGRCGAEGKYKNVQPSK